MSTFKISSSVEHIKVYENHLDDLKVCLIDLATDKDVISPLLFLRQREVIHFNRFKELYDYYKNKGYK